MRASLGPSRRIFEQPLKTIGTVEAAAWTTRPLSRLAETHSEESYLQCKGRNQGLTGSRGVHRYDIRLKKGQKKETLKTGWNLDQPRLTTNLRGLENRIQKKGKKRKQRKHESLMIWICTCNKPSRLR